MKKIVLLAFFYFSLGSLFAQQLTGKVVNEKNEPIPGAIIKIENSLQTCVSKTDGKFEFERLKPGKYRLNITFVGYEPYNSEIEINNQNISIEIPLKVAENMTEEVVVSALRAGQQTPITSSEIDKTDLQKNNLGQDIPYLLNLMPSITTSSDAGTGIGYSKLSIRGTDLTRINVTVNGIPLNDAESQGVYWVDLPDLSSSVENIQIQRGVGSSTIGGGAFGANINFMTNQLQKEAYGQLASTYGSFNSSKITIKAGTGLINKHFAFDMRLSKIHSDGFIDRARTDMESFHTSASYSDSKTLVKFNIFSGKEETYQAWNGIPKVRLENDSTGMMRYQNHWLYSEEETSQMLNSGSRTYNKYTYKNEVDNYKQTHYQIFTSRELLSDLMLNLAFNYTKGKGYYEQYKKDEDLADYQLAPVIIGSNTIESMDLIRRKWLNNDLYVVNLSLDYQKRDMKAVIGGSWQDYFGKHYGTVIWSRYAGNSEIDHQWYYNTGEKKEYNLYGKFEYLLFNKLNIYADLQFRHVDYSMSGIEDKLNDIGQKHLFDFFNPKFGVNYKLAGGQQIYLSYGKANREPTRTDYNDALNDIMPVAESLNDYELGYSYAKQNISLNLNLYLMDYTNQLVKTGKINDVGNAIMSNIADSYRSGVEINSIIKPVEWLEWRFNTTLSKNKVKNYTEFVENWDGGGHNQIYIGESNLSFSSEVVTGNEIIFKPFKGFEVAIISKYVGKQYIDNSSSEDRMLDAYFVNNARLNYHFETKLIKSIDIQLTINNILNEEYETDAWVYRYFYDNAYHLMDGYFPQAGRNLMAGIILNF